LINLEDLKQGDIIYQVCEYYWIQQLKVTKEKYVFEYQLLNEATVYSVECKIQSKEFWNNGTTERLFERDENNLYRTEKEALNYQQQCKQEKINYLMKDNNLVKELYKIAFNTMTNADRELYEDIIKKL
jgi:hypothetical protein